MTTEVTHDFLPVYNENSKILILGSMPSVESRKQGFYYMHPQNRFWRVIEYLLKCERTQTIEQKKNLLLQNGIALWDVLESCAIEGSSDSSIQNPEVNNFSHIFSQAHITRVFTNGKKSYELYNKYSGFAEKYPPVYLPSTSPANAAYSLENLCEHWSVIIK